MNYFMIPVIILSHIVGALYIQKRKYNKLLTACFWGSYAIYAACILLFQKNVILGFFALLIGQAVVFFITSIGTVAEKTFLLLTYANSFCIHSCAVMILSSFLKGSRWLPLCMIAILLLMHLFLYKFIITSYKKSKPFFSCGWRKLNIVLVFFMALFLERYAFADVDTNKLSFAFEFVIFSIIYYSTLILIFDTIKTTALMYKKEIETVELEKSAYIDVLTNTQSRVSYMKFAENQVARHKNNKSNSSFIYAMMDIDDFKKINDTSGHAAGDEILKSVGVVINEHFANFDCHSFRIGGDEFVLLFENKPISDVQDQIVKLNDKLYHSHGIALSYGCCEVDFDNEKPFEEAYKKADALMYSYKENKKLHGTYAK